MFYKSFPDFSLEGTDPIVNEYNQILSNMKCSFDSQYVLEGFIHKKDELYYRKIRILGSKERSVCFSFFKVLDYNKGWKVDKTSFAKQFKEGFQRSFVVVPSMYKGENQKFMQRPFEYYPEDKNFYNASFDPRISVISRNYDGKIADIAKHYKKQVENNFYENYWLVDQRGDLLRLNSEIMEKSFLRDFSPHNNLYEDKQINTESVDPTKI